MKTWKLFSALSFFLCLFSTCALANDTIRLTWNSEAGVAKSFDFKGTDQASFVVVWGDGNKQSITANGYNQTLSHTYASAGIFEVVMYGNNTTAKVKDFTIKDSLISLDISNCADLTSLTVSNDIKILNASGCTALTSLNCYNNKLTSLNISNCTALILLNGFGNDLISLDASGCTALTSLNCYDNNLTSLDVSNCTALTSLWCQNNNLKSLDISNCTALTTLEVSNNNLTTLDVSNCTDLTTLAVSNNNLTTLDVSNCTALETLSCWYNHLTTLDVSGCTAITMLQCPYNHIPLSVVYENFRLIDYAVSTSFMCGEQFNSIVLEKGQELDLSKERIIGQENTVYWMSNASPDSWTENGFVFRFDEPGNYALTLRNSLLPDGLFTWYIQVTGEPSVEKFQLNVSANNPTWGSVAQSGSGEYEKGAEVTITATPNDGYRFVNWTKGGVWFSEEAVHTFTLTEDMALVANFEKRAEEDKRVSLTLSANNTAWGQVAQSGSGEYEEGAEVTVTATANAGYRFVNWTKNGEVFSTNAIHTFSITENMALVANFEEVGGVENYTLTVSANNADWGNVSQSGGGEYAEGTAVIITATANAGYRFVNWTKNGEVFSTNAIHTFSITENMALVANFEEVGGVENYTLTVSANNADWGNVSQSGGGEYAEGTAVIITATANAGYRFKNWTKNGEVFSTNAIHTFSITENTALVANFEEVGGVENYTLTVSANNADWGNVSQSGGGEYAEGTAVIITATANAGYRFKNWTKNGEVFSTNAIHTFSITENTALVANFEEVGGVETYTLTVSANNAAWGNAFQIGGGEYEEGREVTIGAIANAGYRFKNWTKGGEVFSEEAFYTFRITEDLVLVANFEKTVANEGWQTGNLYVYAKGRTIYLSSAMGLVEVYNASGKRVYSGHDTVIPVQTGGLYIVRSATKSFKVMVAY